MPVCIPMWAHFIFCIHALGSKRSIINGNNNIPGAHIIILKLYKYYLLLVLLLNTQFFLLSPIKQTLMKENIYNKKSFKNISIFYTLTFFLFFDIK